MADNPIRVLLAEDSPTVRYHLARLINEAPGLTVIGEARNGQEAVMLAEALKPDVISMDIQMPIMDGLEATRRIMAENPVPIVMCSALVDAEIDLSFQAVQAGALAVVAKPPARTDPNFGSRHRQLISLLTGMAGISLVRRRERFEGGDLDAPGTITSGLAQPLELVAIGASAGGPSALSTLLSSIPSDFPVPIMVVQHLPDEFIVGLSRWLNDVTPLTVQVATDSVRLMPGNVYLSPGNIHMTVARQDTHLMTRLVEEPKNQRYCPSVDVLFHSVAAVCSSSAVGIILTGMGEDGAEGLLALRRAGGRTFAQDRVSCTVFGMPAAAIQRGAVDHEFTLPQISQRLVRYLRTSPNVRG